MTKMSSYPMKNQENQCYRDGIMIFEEMKGEISPVLSYISDKMYEEYEKEEEEKKEKQSKYATIGLNFAKKASGYAKNIQNEVAKRSKQPKLKTKPKPKKNISKSNEYFGLIESPLDESLFDVNLREFQLVKKEKSHNFIECEKKTKTMIKPTVIFNHQKHKYCH